MINPPNYTIIRVLGEGRFSTVYESINIKNGDKVALKATCKLVSGFTHPTFIKNEIEAFKIIKHHPNIIKYFDHFEDEETAYFVLEYFNGYTLQRIVFESYKRPLEVPLTLQMIKNYLKQILEGLKYLHSKNIYHCDLKPENIIIENEKLKIIDFGCSIISELPVNSKKLMYWGTPGYSPPETLSSDNQVFLENVDIWAVACNIYYIFKNKPPFQDASIYKTIQNVKNVDYDKEGMPKYPNFIINSIFIKNPDFRIKLTDLELLIDGFEEL